MESWILSIYRVRNEGLGPFHPFLTKKYEHDLGWFKWTLLLVNSDFVAIMQRPKNKLDMVVKAYNPSDLGG